MLSQSVRLPSPISPDHPTRPEARLVSKLLLGMLADVAASYRIPPGELFLRENDDLGIGNPLEHRCQQAEYRGAFKRAVKLSRDPGFALRCGWLVSAQASHLVGPLVTHASSLRHAIHEIRQFQSLLFDGGELHLRERGPGAELWIAFPLAADVTDIFLREFLVAALVRLLSAFGGCLAELHAANFEHARPAHHHAYTECFGGAERFGAEFSGLVFPVSRLDAPNPHYNPALQSIMHQIAEEHLTRLTSPATVGARLRAHLQRKPAGQVPSMEEAARALGLSSRSLRRRLGEEQTSFREVSQQLQRDTACRMLRCRDYSLQQISDALGFADAPSFSRAFRRWTGTTAVDYRARHIRA